MCDEPKIRAGMVKWSKSLFQRGLTAGSSGNVSVRLEDGGFLATPTNSCLGFLEPAGLSRIDAAGRHVGGALPTKELSLHQAVYISRPQAGAVVHLHSPFATALSCMSDTDPANAVSALTPYVVMRVGRVPVLPYFPPGSERLVDAIRLATRDHPAVLLANHGPVVAASTLEAAVYAIEELEAAAQLTILTRQAPVKPLDNNQIQELHRLFGSP
jgi:ribulose-5-phosphate 4-epimerase/fuculose-1-phosphate aldolase